MPVRSRSSHRSRYGSGDGALSDPDAQEGAVNSRRRDDLRPAVGRPGRSPSSLQASSSCTASPCTHRCTPTPEGSRLRDRRTSFRRLGFVPLIEGGARVSAEELRKEAARRRQAGDRPNAGSDGRSSVAASCASRPGSRGAFRRSCRWAARGFSVGLRGFEPRTSALSVLRSNRLSYSPGEGSRLHHPAASHGKPSGSRSAGQELLVASGQYRMLNDWLAVASSVPSCDHRKALPWAYPSTDGVDPDVAQHPLGRPQLRPRERVVEAPAHGPAPERLGHPARHVVTEDGQGGGRRREVPGHPGPQCRVGVARRAPSRPRTSGPWPPAPRPGPGCCWRRSAGSRRGGHSSGGGTSGGSTHTPPSSICGGPARR